MLLLQRGPDPTPQLTPLVQAAVGLALLPELACASAVPATAIGALAPLIAGATGYRLISGELGATVDTVAALLGPADGTAP